MTKTFCLQIKGRVQGVGFRPFVYNLAKQLKLNGEVSNNEEGVVIVCNANRKKLELFLSNLKEKKPEISVISSISYATVTDKEFGSFSIVPSKAGAKINIPLTPDFAVCDDCKSDITNPKNRRYNYAFTSCVNCGPRYAITQKFPFERNHTSMDKFPMCSACQKEYANPKDRRFHSQTNSCPECGIELTLNNSRGELMTKNQNNIFSQVEDFLSQGKIIAIKNTNGYLLCCDASNKKAIQNLRQRKQRPNKPFAVLYPSIESVQRDFDINQNEKQLLQSRVAPIVILQNSTKPLQIEAEAIAPTLNQTGVMLPSSALLSLIIQKFKKPIVATSGNMHGSPIIKDEQIAEEQLNGVADYFLHHNLDIEFAQDDSVLKCVDDFQLIYRRSRGLAPSDVGMNVNFESSVLAMGAHLKSTFSYLPNNQIYVSQYFGHLDNYEVLNRLEHSILKFEALFDTPPKTILIDAHEQYQSSILGRELAEELSSNVKHIQHHKAHFASVLGEHDLFQSKEKILGVVWDGVGLGDDKMIWGGEFFTYQNREIQRLSHIEYYDWLANDKMAKEPRLALFSLLDQENRRLIKDKFTKTEWQVYSKTVENNSLKTSSVGRLFDAVASALELTEINTYEAESAMQLEKYAELFDGGNAIDFLEEIDYTRLPSTYVVNRIFSAYKSGMSKERLAFSFIFTLAKSIIKVALLNKIKTIACSGGVFQNAVLVSLVKKMAVDKNLIIKINRKLSPNDENLSFGQLMYNQNVKN